MQTNRTTHPVPLGDSITEITCWRTLLWDNLAAAGLTDKFVFVGSMTNNPQNCVGKTSNWDKHHEGHSGYLAVNIANTNLPTWLKSNVPDIVMFMLGTNDVAQGKTTTDINGAYTKMVGELRRANPNVKIIVRNPSPSQHSEPVKSFISTLLTIFTITDRHSHSSTFRPGKNRRPKRRHPSVGQVSEYDCFSDLDCGLQHWFPKQ
jgi:hypothetical protein